MLSAWVAMVAPLGSSQPSRVPYPTSEAEGLWPGEQGTEAEAGCGAGREMRSRIWLGWEDRQGQTW